MDPLKKKMEINRFFFASTDKTKEVLKKYNELWNGIKNLIKEISDKPSKYRKDFTKIKFNSHDSLPLNKTLKLHNLALVVWTVFEEDGK